MLTNKPTLVYFDHFPHRFTKSTVFLSDILKKDFELVEMWDDEWELNSVKTINEINKHTYVLFFQIIPEIGFLRKIKAKIIWVPMVDGVYFWPKIKWRLLSTVSMKILCFSEYLTGILKLNNFDFLNLKLYANPSNLSIVPVRNKANVFLWQRANVTFNKIKSYINPDQINKFILRIDKNEMYKNGTIPSNADVKKYRIEIVNGDIGKKDHIKLMKKCNVFFAPRYFEGIGWSFIEAMTMRMLVVAFDYPTMNEYIVNNLNGILINENKVEVIDLIGNLNFANQARNSCLVGYRNWLIDSRKISSYIQSNYPVKTACSIEKKYFFRTKYLLASIISNYRFNLFLNK